MSSTLEDFLKTGQIGAIALGISVTEVMQLLGEPDFASEKVNPSVFKYGRLELTFWKAQSERAQRLREIVVTYSWSFEHFPSALEFADWPQAAITEQQFRMLLDHIGYEPVRDLKGTKESELLFASGVSVTILDGMLKSLRMRLREIRSQPSLMVSNEREPTKDQILDMLSEADQAYGANAHRAAVLVGWAALEAILRRLAMSHEIVGKTRVQPAVLLNDLVAAHILTAEEGRLLQRMRQIRMEIAHGLKRDTSDSAAVFTRLASAARTLVDRLD